MSLTTALRDTFQGFKSLVTGMRITAREAAKPIITVQYPHDTLKMPKRFRGHIQLLLDPETGRARCTACMLCAKACPSECIDLDGVKREGEKKKSVSRYELDFTKCSLCGSCVEVCPSDALDFSKDYNVVSVRRDDFGKMDLYRKVEDEAKAWAAAHPAPTTAPAAPAAATPAAAPVSATPATPKPVAAPAAVGPVPAAEASPPAAPAQVASVMPAVTTPATPEGVEQKTT